jgi:hypothetical protein
VQALVGVKPNISLRAAIEAVEEIDQLLGAIRVSTHLKM